ncbi:MAG: RodZ domain-containing protein [Thermovirgaceae bacterium]|nr:DUF4115 domain-containing protein [Synergistales bacterium]HPC75807.1 DUF4115 domain-containing protein [Synergistales bacterium]HRS48634.1 DUF4115 domain-containing protein [Thermovirgaceae bacterium]HRU90777.1 DUF4115 domain-containing protein [Thermovirgaceae bacterium]
MTEEARNALQLGEEAGGRRREKGLKLSEVSERTKIRLPFLEAIEEGSLQELPQSIYARGFVKAYLEVIDSLDLWPEYEEVFRSLPGGDGLAESLVQYMPPQKGFQKVSKAWMFLFLFFAIGISLYLIWQQKDLMTVKAPTLPSEEAVSGDVAVSPGEALPDIAVDTVETHPAPDAGGATSLQEATPAPGREDTSWLPGHEGETLAVKPVTAGILMIRAKGPCWIGVNREVGGKVQKTLYAGDSFETSIDSRTTIRFGSAGAVSLTWDDREVEPIGRMGEVVTIEFLPDGSMKRL